MKMNFEQFKKEWSDAMVHRLNESDYEEEMHELYIRYKKDGFQGYKKGFTVKQWCEFVFVDYDLDKHLYMLKEKWPQNECSDCGTKFTGKERCPECNPMG